MKIREICVLGGTGFVGGHLVGELTRRGYRTRVLTRRRERHRELLVYPTCEVVEANIHYVSELSNAVAGCDAVINLVGILNEPRRRSGEDFPSVHAELPGKVIEACRFNRIGRYLHMSALNASPKAPSKYLRTKAAGEEAAHAAPGDLQVTSFRPSVIFGRGDSFFNRFAALLALSPGVFPLACAGSRFAPVYVGDVAAAFAEALESRATWGKRYDLCGPRSYTLKELVEYTAAVSGHRRLVVALPDGLARLQARVLEHVPGKPFTMDNYRSLQVPSTCRDNGLAALGIRPESVETVVPKYLARQDRNALYSDFRRLAGRN